jgi:DNA-binding NarL/FixJ family response regulator
MTFGLRERQKMKLHQDKNYLQTKINEGFTSKDIGKELRVSYKLVEIYLRKYGIGHTPKNKQD